MIVCLSSMTRAGQGMLGLVQLPVISSGHGVRAAHGSVTGNKYGRDSAGRTRGGQGVGGGVPAVRRVGTPILQQALGASSFSIGHTPIIRAGTRERAREGAMPNSRPKTSASFSEGTVLSVMNSITQSGGMQDSGRGAHREGASEWHGVTSGNGIPSRAG